MYGILTYMVAKKTAHQKLTAIILTNVQNYFTERFSRKFVVIKDSNTPSSATLHCEVFGATNCV